MKHGVRLTLMAISGGLYGCAYIFAPLWFCTLFFLLPLFIVVLDTVDEKRVQLRTSELLVWSTVGMVLQHVPIGYSMVLSGPGSTWHQFLRLLPLIPILAFTVTVSFFCLWSIPFLLSKIRRFPLPWGGLFGWILTLTLYFYTIVNWYMIIFGRLEGYAMLDPLLPLAHIPFLVYPLVWLPQFVGMFILILFNATIACTVWFWVKKRWCQAGLAAMLVISLILAWCDLGALVARFGMPARYADAYATLCTKTIHCPGLFYRSRFNIVDTVAEMSDHYAQAIKCCPDAEVIFTQESVCNVTAFPYTQTLTQFFDAEHLGRPVHLLLGAFRWDEDRRYNTLYWLYNGQLKEYHDKRHAMQIEEQIPWFLPFQFAKNAFFGPHYTPLTPSKSERKVFSIMPGIQLIPYICSEFFFNRNPDEPDDIACRHIPILAACNDHWAKTAHLRALMALFARYRAITWQRVVVYSANHYGLVIAPNGTECQLRRFEHPGADRHQAR